MSKSLLLLILTIFFLSSCSKYSSKSADPHNSIEPEAVPGVQRHHTQIGNFYDRVVGAQEIQKQYSRSILKIENSLTGSPGIAVFLGLFEDLYIFVTNKHVFDADKTACDEFLSVSSTDGLDFFTCSEIAFSMKNMDLTFFGAERWSGSRDLHPQIFKSSAFAAQESLTLRTIDRDLNQIVIDQGQDCFALDFKPRFIKDPDTLSDLSLSSWSLPIGCDSQPGDSGSPVFDQEGFVAGILWGGKTVKNFKSSADILLESLTGHELVWRDYNFMVPASAIKLGLETGVESTNLRVSRLINRILNFNFE